MTQVSKRDDEAHGLILHPDGRIVLGGFVTPGGWPPVPKRFALARYLADGSLDASFGDGGLVRTRMIGSDATALAIALQGTDRIVAAGWVVNERGRPRCALARYEW